MTLEKNSPMIRFPTYSEEWRKVELAEALSIFNGYAFSSGSSVESGVRWVKIADVGIQSMKRDNLSYLPESFLESHPKFVLNQGDYVIALTRPILNGKLKIARISNDFHRSLLNQRVGKIITANDSTFIFNLLQRAFVIKSIEKNIAGTDPPNLGTNDINSIPVCIPVLVEQQKIATFLTAVDDKIQQLSKKKALLEKYKTGVMQQIFSQEIRFEGDDGKNYPKWEMKTLGEITSLISNGLSLTQNSSAEGFKVTRIETISERSINLSKVGYVLTDQDISSYRLKIGDVLFSNINSTAHIGKLVLVKADYNLYHGMNLLRIQFDISKYNATFFAYQLGSKEYKNYFEMICNRAVNQASINQADLKKTRLRVPHVAEQTKIANFLSALDDKIGLVNQQIELTRQYKKGLLQQMFV